MSNPFSKIDGGLPLYPVHSDNLDQWLEDAPGNQRNWLRDSGFRARPGELCSLPDANGELHGFIFGMQNSGWLYQLAALPAKLAPDDYELIADWQPEQRLQASLGWGLACYKFDLYRKSSKKTPKLVLDEDFATRARQLFSAQSMVRDLINTPTEDMGPLHLADAMQAEADELGAHMTVVHGKDLLTENFPAIHAVGRASDREPRLLKMEWGQPHDPLLALCGKGVCFDTGGLNLKPAAGMRVMKKDMGGAAHVLALARLVIEAQLPVRLMVLIPAVENSVSGNAYRPGDVIATRKGLNIEIGNTDAEGRVVLADALAYACEHEPDLVMDFATLTGAARIAMGADLPPVFSNDIDIANALVSAGEQEEDPLWALPLYQPYNELIKSPIADLCNVGSTSYGGCITAALFLEHFVNEETDWVHIDTFGWNQTARPGRPAGGEALGLRASFNYLKNRYM
jgi:leucyl aminopeptidase